MLLEQKIIGLTFGLISLLLIRQAEALNVVPARLDLEIESGYCDTSTPLKLCIGGDSNCYDIPDNCRNDSGCYNSNTCIVTMHTILGIDLQIDDHPFVNHPDDWDYVYIKNDSESGFFLKRLKLTLTTTNINVPNPTTGNLEVSSGSGDYIFANWSAPGAGRLFPKERNVPIFDWIKKGREVHVKKIFCGDDEFCLKLEFKDLHLPWAVREQTYDVGQAGIVKYRPWDADTSTQFGCDEAFNYYSSQFTNNIHYSCDYDANDCSYFKHWETDNDHMDFEMTQMASAGRLYKLVFNEMSVPCSTGPAKNRTGPIEARLCTNAKCTTVDDSVSYHPKVGDYFVRVNTSNDKFHAMTLLREYSFPLVSPQVFIAPVIHKRGDIIRAEEANQRVNRKNGTCSDPYLFNYYVGEVDHEIDPDGNGPLTSGARPPEIGPNYGFRISLIPLY